jgi:hypothetical protein
MPIFSAVISVTTAASPPLIEAPAHFLKQALGRERLGKHSAGCYHSHVRQLPLGIGRHQDERDVRVGDRHRFEQLDPVEPGHDDVGEHQLDRRRAPLEDLEGLDTVDGLMDDVAVVLENPAGIAPDRLLVVDHEHVTPFFDGTGRQLGSGIRTGI